MEKYSIVKDAFTFLKKDIAALIRHQYFDFNTHNNKTQHDYQSVDYAW